MDKTMVIGNLTADPVCRNVDTANGEAIVCNFSIAVNRYAGGNKTTKYYRVSCWNKQAENAGKYLKKGSKVYVSGTASARAFTNRDGILSASLEIDANEIEYLSSRQDASQNQEQPEPSPQTDPDGFMDIPEGAEDELPFN